ncbi:hypothetical protein NQ176_g3860 [Zarea fungicola]|uniref:Uncharacterized protein n=1 Tax=Zarea fungicola TaxID=93591 RepID=A0ACC1NH24_9HYPO|nr:hypothetical protein NQ176_g3860 [Lecanicillium fungicola]
MRILLRGQAGMGKSTICKKVLYDFIHNGLWSHIIRRIIWLPLRNFKRKNIKSIKQLLEETFFPDDELLMEALWADLEQDSTKTLFVLDGLDEVPDGIGSDGNLLQALLSQPRVIVTARPYAAGRDLGSKFDLELQTIGFYPTQVKEYIYSVAPKLGNQISAYIRKQPLVNTLARIPIQLDALCITLDTGPQPVHDSPKSMTALYKNITECIWRQDAQRLEKIWADRPITKENALGSYSEEILCRVQGELNLLKELAFNGFHDDMDEFGPEYLKRFWKLLSLSVDLSRESSRKVQSNEVDTLSFLRTSNGGSTADTRTYHFMHRTFQEFFAAQYFVEHWRLRKPLTVQGISPDEFLQKEKYNGRYAIFWRFVSGLLDDNDNKCTIERFFRTIQMEPLDLLGYSHQRLLIDCLSEVSTSLHFRKPIEENLKAWLLFDKITAVDAETLENVFLDVLRNGSDKSKNHILNCLGPRHREMPKRIVDLGISLLRNNGPYDSKRAFLTALCLTKAELTPNDLSVLLKVNSGDEQDLSSVSAKTVQNGPPLSEDCLNTIKMWPGTIFGPTESRFAFTKFCKPHSLEDEVPRSIAQRLNSHWLVIIDFRVILLNQAELSAATVTLLTRLLEHKSWVMRMTALDILKKHSIISSSVVDAVTETINAAAIQDLRTGLPKQHLGPNLRSSDYNSTETIPETDLMLVHQHLSLRETALVFLAWGPRVSNAILEVVAEALDDSSIVAKNAAQALRRNSPLPDTVLAIIAKHLKSKHYPKLRSVLDSLGDERRLPDEILKLIVALFNIQGCGALLDRADSVLYSQEKSYSEEVLNVIVESISNGAMEEAAANRLIISVQFPSSDRYYRIFAGWLDNHTPKIRTAVLYTLCSRHNLPDYIVVKVIQLFRHMSNDRDDNPERNNALRLLADVVEKFDKEVGNRREGGLGARLEEPSFIEEIHELALSLLGHSDFRIQKDGILLLQRRRCWFPDILDKLTEILTDNFPAFSALNKEKLKWSFQKELYRWLLKGQHRDKCAGLMLASLLHHTSRNYIFHDSWDLWSLYVIGDTCFINSPGEIFSLKLYDTVAFKESVKKYKAKARPDMPPVVSGGEANEEG